MSGTPSVSRRGLVLEVGTDRKLGCDLRRHLSPRTVRLITKSLPLRGNAHRMGKNIIYIETAIDSGLERERSEFKRGDVAFLPSTGSVCFFLNDVASTNKMTPIGRLVGDVRLLEDAEPSTPLSIRDAAASGAP